MKQANIRTKSLSKWYGDVRGVSGINLEIEKGIIGLVGPNSAGKSTLINLICGLLAPSQGNVEILGEQAFGGIHFRRHVGVASQKESIYPFMTVLEFVTSLTQLHGFCKKEAKQLAISAIEKVQISHKLHQKAKTLSKGMRQSLKLAQAIAHHPKILLLDEILTGCDPLVKHHIKKLLREMAHEGATILLTSHNLKEIELLTDHVIILDRGKVVAHGTIEALQQRLKKENHSLRIHGRELRSLARKLLEHSETLEIRLTRSEQELFVTTTNAEMLYSYLTEIIVCNNYWVEKIIPVDHNLESLFRQLVGGIH